MPAACGAAYHLATLAHNRLHDANNRATRCLLAMVGIAKALKVYHISLDLHHAVYDDMAVCATKHCNATLYVFVIRGATHDDTVFAIAQEWKHAIPRDNDVEALAGLNNLLDIIYDAMHGVSC